MSCLMPLVGRRRQTGESTLLSNAYPACGLNKAVVGQEPRAPDTIHLSGAQGT